jgi:hypothetical protein
MMRKEGKSTALLGAGMFLPRIIDKEGGWP